MRLGVHAVGRMKAGPERDLATRYLDRFAKLGPTLGFDFTGVDEIAESRAPTVELRRQEEAQRLQHRLAEGAALIALDERGKNLASDDLARNIERWRDAGHRSLVLAIGGPDGHDETIRRRADLLLSFGAQTWPHQLVRIMLAEQLYRVATILSGHPYHRA